MHRWGPLAVAAVVAVMLTGLVKLQATATGCRASDTVALASSEEKFTLMTDVAAGFNATHPRVGDQCLAVRVEKVASGIAEQDLAAGWTDKALPDGQRPDVWSPAAATWILLLNQELATRHAPAMAPANSPSLFRSPLVIGMPRPMAQAIEASGQPVGWSDIFQLAGDRSGWGRFGHPELGPFQLAQTNPRISTSGLHAMIAAYYAASGRSSNLTPELLADPTVVRYVGGVERSVVHYGDSVSNFLSNLQRADAEGRALSYVSAITMEEKEVLDYNQGLGTNRLPTVPLVAIYPKEGTLAADHPYAILDAAWVTPSKRAGATAFLQYLQSPTAQAQFRQAGFRDQRGIPGSVISQANGLRPELPQAYLQPPPGPTIQAVQASWNALRKRAKVLLIIDSSAFAKGLSPKQLAESVSAGLKQLGGDDQVGVWELPPAAGNPLPYIDVVSVRPLQGDETNLQGTIGAMRASAGPIKLYLALASAATAMGANADPARVNAVVLISAGRSTDPADADRFSVLAQLSGLASQVPGVHVFTVAVGHYPDKPTRDEVEKTLRQIELSGKGAFYDGSDPNNVSRALAAVISNF